MKIIDAQGLAELIRRDKEVLLSQWESEVRKLPRESKLSAPVLRDHVPVFIDEMVRDLEQLAVTERSSNVSRIHGEQRQTKGLDVTYVVEEYKLLRVCIIDRAELAGFAVAGSAGRSLNRIIDDSIKAAVSAYTSQQLDEERRRREEYLTFIMHDLRSPLSAIYHTMIVLEQRLLKARSEELDLSIPATVKRNIERMETLIQKLMREEQNIRTEANVEVRYAVMPLRPVVEKALQTLASLCHSAKTDVINEVPADILLSGDSELLERVFENLVCNAVEYTPVGTVKISASMASDGGVECWVTDNGKGIPDDVQPTIFDKHQTTRRRHGGLGLGLAVVKKIVEAHGGTIHLDSKVNDGTTIRFTFPARSVGEAPSATEAS